MMSTLLQEKARELLDQNEVSLIIGYGEFFRRANDTSLQRIISPIFISKPVRPHPSPGTSTVFITFPPI